MKRVRRVLVAIATVAAAACEPGGPVIPSPNAPGEIRQSVPGHPNLVQIVRVAPAEPGSGDTIDVTTVLRNVGSATSQALEVSICGPGLKGTLALANPFVSCAGHSMQVSLAPGDSTTDATRRIVQSGPGTYVLEVNQLRQPETWLTVTVHVR